MLEIKESLLKEFAELGVIIGTNVQKGQLLQISAPVEAYKLVEKCVEVAYKQGASRVLIDWLDNPITRMGYENMSTEELCDIPDWQIEKIKYAIDKGVCYLHIISDDPDLLKGVDQNKVKQASIARMKKVKPFQYYSMNNIGQWSIIAYPNVKWAKKVFPDKNDDEALKALWDAILMTSRVEEGKTVENWKIHNAEIKKHTKLMNEYNFKELYFKNSLGTDLKVGLIKNHIWLGGRDTAKGNGATFNPNIPSEEVFTMPNRYDIEGKVYSTKPLSYNGNLIENFNLTFKEGKVVEFHAEKNEEVLKNLLEMDEGAKSLGEVALISYDSPISNSNILFYDTLFDENASCHLALGACYPTTVKGGCELTSEQLYELGGNDSMDHVDFMFGSKDMSVIGVSYDGKEVEVFRDGNFCI